MGWLEMGGLILKYSHKNNPLGIVYPTENIEQMAAALGLQDSDRIIDVGGGANPLPEANQVIDYNLISGHDRDGTSAKIDHRWLAADIEQLPFKNNSFDFAYCSHVLEHVRHPDKACQELARIASRGYIETPNKATEYFVGHPSHRWLVDLIDGVLVFERRWFIEHPLHNIALAQAQCSPRIYQQGLINFRNLTCNQILWHNHIQYKIIERDDWKHLFDYDNPLHAGLSHFYFALNMIANKAPFNHFISHINIAQDNRPNDYRVLLLLGTVQLLMNNWQIAENMLLKARQMAHKNSIEIVDPSLEYNLKQLLLTHDKNQIITIQLPLNKGIIDNQPC
jgi:SAM-dependent methyltransferase